MGRWGAAAAVLELKRKEEEGVLLCLNLRRKGCCCCHHTQTRKEGGGGAAAVFRLNMKGERHTLGVQLMHPSDLLFLLSILSQLLSLPLLFT